MINYLTAKICEVSTTWFQKPGARLRHYDEVHVVCALALLTPGLKSLSEISFAVSVQCAPTAVRGSDGTVEESQGCFGVLTTRPQVFKSAI